MRIIFALFGALVAIALGAGVYVYGILEGWYGRSRDAGEIVGAAIPGDIVETRIETQRASLDEAGFPDDTQILFGDLHVHSTFSTDAFVWALPLLRGEGANPLADACDFARYCSALDFWSITDHAEAMTPRRWAQSVESIQECAARSDADGVPDVIPFMGFEWTQVGALPSEHYGHKNVIFRSIEADEISARPIAAAGVTVRALRDNAQALLPPEIALLDLPNRQDYYDFGRFVQEVRDTPLCDPEIASADLPRECYEIAATPADLVARLDSQGVERLIIPHGSSWGFYTPPGTTWDHQLRPGQPVEEFSLIEIYSGHGNSEEYRSWRAFDGTVDAPECPEPSANYLPSCWRAGEIIEERCLLAGVEEAECADRAAIARRNAASIGLAGHLTVQGEDIEDWLDSGQCRDCFLPAFNLNPTTSVQYGLAISNFEGDEPRRFHWGFIGSSDTHTARPGIGYKPVERHYMADVSGAVSEDIAHRFLPPDPEAPPYSVAIDRETLIRNAGFQITELERQASFFTGGGLAAAHVRERSRDGVWEALESRRVYATSGLRQLLWFDMLDEDGQPIAAMGEDVDLAATPRFRVRAVGSFVQQPGCPDYAVRGLPAERLEGLCRNECYNPGDERHAITRIEVVRIRPQIEPEESVDLLIEDVWRTLECDDEGEGCVAEFDDPEFLSRARDAIYYVRAIQEPTGQINGAGLRCEYDADGQCIRANPCFGDYRTPMSDDCVAQVEHRAWSSPIYVGYQTPLARVEAPAPTDEAPVEEAAEEEAPGEDAGGADEGGQPTQE